MTTTAVRARNDEAMAAEVDSKQGSGALRTRAMMGGGQELPSVALLLGGGQCQRQCEL